MIIDGRHSVYQFGSNEPSHDLPNKWSNNTSIKSTKLNLYHGAHTRLLPYWVKLLNESEKHFTLNTDQSLWCHADGKDFKCRLHLKFDLKASSQNNFLLSPAVTQPARKNAFHSLL